MTDPSKICLTSNSLRVKFLSFRKTRRHPADDCGSHSAFSRTASIGSSLCESPKSGVASVTDTRYDRIRLIRSQLRSCANFTLG